MPDSQNPKVFRRLRTYVLNAHVLNIGDIHQFPLQIDQGCDFEWVSKIASVASASPGYGGVRVGIQDSASGRQLIITNPPAGSAIRPDTVIMDNYFGTAQLPALHVQPYVFKRGTTVWITLDGPAIPATIEIVFDGFDLVEEDAQGRGASGQLVHTS